MSQRCVTAFAIFLSALFAGTPSAAWAQQGGTLNYEGADISAVARDVANRTGRALVIDPRLSGRVNIFSPPDIVLTPDEMWEVFLQTLQVNGFSAVPIGDREFKIVPSQQAIRDGGSGVGTQGGAGTVTRVIPLRFVDARAAASNLRGLTSETGIVTPIPESNSLVLVDTGNNIERILNVIRRFDVDTSVVRTITLENAAASDVANTLSEVLGASGGEGRRISPLSVVPVDASNSLILRGPAEEIARLAPVIRELDKKGSGRLALDTVYLNHADAEELVPIIKEMLETSFPNGGAAGIKPSVGFHKSTNALIINGPPEVQRLIRSIVSRLDIRRPQVQIEAIVVEIADTTARDLGVQYVTGGDSLPISGTNFRSTSPNVVSAAGAAYFLGPGGVNETSVTRGTGDEAVTGTEINPNDPVNAVAGQLVTAAVGELLNVNGFLFGAGGELDDGSVFGVLVSAIQNDSNSNVLSVPSVTVLDNETASLQVGQAIPIVTGEAVGTDFQGGFRTVERKDVGNILEVTPQINDGNMVVLDINLEISSIGAFTSLTDDIITNKSNIQTKTSIEDGKTLVLGGLIDSNHRFTESKVPLLGDIPLLGNLFKGQNKQKEETMLMVFIRPTILRDGMASDGVTARKYKHVLQRQKDLRRGMGHSLDDIFENYLGTESLYPPLPKIDAEGQTDE